LPKKSKPVIAVSQKDDGRSKILQAALDCFASYGFEAASIRRIAEDAGVMHQLIVYHFKTKEQLWREVVRYIFEEYYDGTLGGYFTSLTELEQASGPAAALRGMIVGLVEFTAKCPQFHRISTFEGKSENSRFFWLMENYALPYYKFGTGLIKRAQMAGGAADGHPGRLYYGLIGIATTSFTFELEYRKMTKLRPFDPSEVRKVSEMACRYMGLQEILAS
jgi:AcrR family transcriptional regulator